MTARIAPTPTVLADRGRPRKSMLVREQQLNGLLRVALKTIAIHGPSTSMDDIARAAGMSKPLIYTLCGSKSGFSAAMVDYVFGDMLSTIAGSTEEFPVRLTQAIDGIATAVAHNVDVYRFLVDRHTLANQPLLTTLAPLISKIFEVEKTPAEIGITPVLAMIFSGLECWILDENRIPQNIFVERMTKMLSTALA
ncbi:MULTISPECIES: TetR/AcrR family transcriptional regulator [Nocardia]|uniref:TetR/AcrR family transcriptional regulator n=1 Tax=Nocardia TaxID=1817 RepID=UPI000D699EB8|nr:MULTISPECIES: TetR/AcrR family transcriptional regulator [Nocardia]